MLNIFKKYFSYLVKIMKLSARSFKSYFIIIKNNLICYIHSDIFKIFRLNLSYL